MTIKQIYRKGIVKSIKELFERNSEETRRVGPDVKDIYEKVTNFLSGNILRAFYWNSTKDNANIFIISIPYDLYVYISNNLDEGELFNAFEDFPCTGFVYDTVNDHHNVQFTFCATDPSTSSYTYSINGVNVDSALKFVGTQYNAGGFYTYCLVFKH